MISLKGTPRQILKSSLLILSLASLLWVHLLPSRRLSTQSLLSLERDGIPL